MDNPIVWIIVILIIILVSREILCWYWKINEILNEKEKQTRILEEILYTMNPKATYFDEKEEEEKKNKYIL